MVGQQCLVTDDAETVRTASRMQRGDGVDERPARREAFGADPGSPAHRVGKTGERAAHHVDHAGIGEVGGKEIPIEREDRTMADGIRSVASVSFVR